MRFFFALEVMETVLPRKKEKKSTEGNWIAKRNFLPNTEQGKSTGQVVMTGQIVSKDIWAEILDTGDWGMLDSNQDAYRTGGYGLRWGASVQKVHLHHQIWFLRIC